MKDRLPSEVYERLCACRNVKSDIPIMVNVKWQIMKERGLDAKGYTKEDALVSILELLDANSQYYDLTKDEYNEWKS